jgi:photosystem II stability/assembly factor-like uncharacterized protein
MPSKIFISYSSHDSIQALDLIMNIFRGSVLFVAALLIGGCTTKTTTTVVEPDSPNRGVITGKVFDAYSDGPIGGALVSFFSGTHAAITASDGSFEVDSLPIGSDILTITRSGYHTYTDTVSIVTGHLTTYTAYIMPSIQGWITGWKQASSGTAQTLTGACWANATTVYACGFAGVILLSTDEGNSWSNVNSPTQENLYCIHFFDPNNGIVTGNKGIIYITSNGGGTWGQTNFIMQNNYRNVSFSDPTHGYIVGGDGFGGSVIITTSDGGKSWTDLTGNVQAVATSKGLYGVASPSPSIVFAGSSDGKIFNSSDGGSTWIWRSGAASFIHSFSFINTLIGVCAGSSVTIEHTEDGGNNWSNYITGANTGDFDCITFPDKRHITAVGTSGLIMHSRTGGSLWLNQTFNTTSQLYYIATADSLRNVIVGEKGIILIPVVQ